MRPDAFVIYPDRMSDLPGPQDKPFFLDPAKAATAEYVEVDPDKKPDFEAVDFMEPDPVVGAKPLRPRHREVARLHAFGKTNNEIAKMLNYHHARVSQILNTSAVQAEIQRFRDRVFESDVITRMKELGPDAVNVIEELLRDPGVKAEKKISAAQWLIEKLTGKAKQEVNVESNTLAAFMEIAKEMQQRGETLEPLDVTPKAGETGTKLLSSGESKFKGWVDSEL